MTDAICRDRIGSEFGKLLGYIEHREIPPLSKITIEVDNDFIPEYA
ncbi:MAG: hypothetical protein V1927_00465 [Candidatus Omnitrophota bacterium]